MNERRKHTKQGLVTTDQTITKAVLAGADTARQLDRQKGNGNQAVCNMTSVGALANSVSEHILDLNVIARISEGRKDRHARIPEGTLLTEPHGQQLTAWAVIDALECEAQLARWLRSRASMTLLGLAPEGSLPKVDSSQRVRYLALPPGAPVGPGGIQLDSPPHLIVELLCRTFGCVPAQIHVTLLRRASTLDLADEYTAAGATVEFIMAGDFQAQVEAGQPVEPGGPVRIAVGLGGLPEAFLAAIFMKATGGTIFMQAIPPEMELRASEVRSFVFDQHRMIRSDDCLLVAAGISEAETGRAPRYLVPGVRRSGAARQCWVTVLVASPLLPAIRYYVVEYNGDAPGEPIPLPPGETLDEFLLLRYLTQGREIESSLWETAAGDREFFQSWYGCLVPGLEGLTEHELLALLQALHQRGALARSEAVTSWDSAEYHVRWNAGG